MLPAIELVSMNNLASVHKERITNCRNTISTKSIRDAALEALKVKKIDEGKYTHIVSTCQIIEADLDEALRESEYLSEYLRAIRNGESVKDIVKKHSEER